MSRPLGKARREYLDRGSGAFGTGGVVVAGVFAARATRQAAAATAEATETVARVQAEPDQRRADLETFKTIRDDMQREIGELRVEQSRLRSLVRAFVLYVGELMVEMRRHGVDPPDPPARVDEYNRTGV